MAIEVATGLPVNNIKIVTADGDKYTQMARNQDHEVIWPNYVKDGMYAWLDAELNDPFSTENGRKGDYETWKDLSGNGNDFTISGIEQGPYGYLGENNSLGYDIRVMQIRDLSDNMKIYRDGFDPFSAAHTLEFCCIPTHIVNYSTLFRTINDSNYRERWIPSSGRASYRVYNNTPVVAGTSYACKANNYYTISFVRAGGSGSQNNKVYINGVQAASTNTSRTNVTVSRFFIFSRNRNQYNFYGYACGFRRYTRALTRAEILQNSKIDRIRFDKSITDPNSLYE